MEKNENYMEYLLKIFEFAQEDIQKHCDNINVFQELLGFKRIYNPTNRAINSCVENYKKIKEKNFNEQISKELEFMYELYMISKLGDATDKLIEYDVEIGYIFNKKNTFRSFFRNNNGMAIKEWFIDSQKHINRYYEIGEEIYNSNFEKNVDEIVEVYIEFLYELYSDQISDKEVIKENLLRANTMISKYLEVLNIEEDCEKMDAKVFKLLAEN